MKTQNLRPAGFPSNWFERANLIRAVRTPLGFFTLVTLVIEGVLAAVTYTITGPEKTTFFLVEAGSLVLVFTMVFLIVFFRPDALALKRSSSPEPRDLSDALSRVLGGEIYVGINEALAESKQPSLRVKVLRNLCQTLRTSPYPTSKSDRQFMNLVADTIQQRAGLGPEKHKRAKPASHGRSVKKDQPGSEVV